tara:strand:+ start:136 stop:609 length:474 start_codon:yes stop_codon:yes gene_type:complete
MATTKKRISDLPSLTSLTANDIVIVTSGENQVSYKVSTDVLGAFLLPLLSANIQTSVDTAVANTPVLLKGQATLDFGTGSITTSTAVTSITGITANSIVMCAVKIVATSEHPVDDLLVDPIRVHTTNVIPGVGFTVYGQMDTGRARGTYTIHWTATV